MDIREYNTKRLPYHFVLFYHLSEKEMEIYRNVLCGLPRDNAVLTYCYLDMQCGLSYRALCCAAISSDGTVEYDVPEKINAGMTIREGGIESDAVILDEGGSLEQFQKEVDSIKECYGYHEDLVKINKKRPFDEYRHPSYPNDILVYFFSPDEKIEQIWVTEGEQNSYGEIWGKLINEPYNPLVGVHNGDTVNIIPYDLGDGKIIPTAVLPWMKK